MKEIIVAVPYDYVESPLSQDFVFPVRIGEYDVKLLQVDTDGVNCKNKIEWAREILAKEFLKTKYDKILFLDSDIIVHADDLLPLVTSKHEVASAMYPYRAAWYQKDDIQKIPKEEGVFLQGGLGCCCIHRKVFEEIEPPWFGRRGRKTAWKREDWNFYRNCYRIKIFPFVYPDISVGHQDRETGDIYYHSMDKTRIIKVERGENANSKISRSGTYHALETNHFGKFTNKIQVRNDRG